MNRVAMEFFYVRLDNGAVLELRNVVHHDIYFVSSSKIGHFQWDPFHIRF